MTRVKVKGHIGQVQMRVPKKGRWAHINVKLLHFSTGVPPAGNNNYRTRSKGDNTFGSIGPSVYALSLTVCLSVIRKRSRSKVVRSGRRLLIIMESGLHANTYQYKLPLYELKRLLHIVSICCSSVMNMAINT